MIGCLWTGVHKQSNIALYFESENELKFYNLEASVHSFWTYDYKSKVECCELNKQAFFSGQDKA